MITKNPWIVGKNYLIRTVTMIYIGHLKAIFDKELILLKCAWIADTGRWADACKTGSFSEVEPYPADANVIIGRDAILDAFIIGFKLPEVQK